MTYLIVIKRKICAFLKQKKSIIALTPGVIGKKHLKV